MLKTNRDLQQQTATSSEVTLQVKVIDDASPVVV